MKEILPIGAVVLLEEVVDSLMIIGYLPKGIDENFRDYMGVPYPTGLMSMEDVKAFNKEDIKKVIFEGNKENLLFQKFIEKINKDELFDKKNI